MAGNTKLTDLGWSDFIDSINRAARVEVAVGIHSGSANEDGEDLVAIGAANEFGTETIPSRPFMAYTFDSKFRGIEQALMTAGDRILDGAPTYQELGRVGQRLQEWIKGSIATWTEPPNAPATVARKGRNEPLRDTYSMMKSIRWVVRPRTDGI